jgi:hypothetical protein
VGAVKQLPVPELRSLVREVAGIIEQENKSLNDGGED